MSLPNNYTVNPQREQDSITEFLETQYGHLAVIPDGMVNADHYGPDEDIPLPRFDDQTIKPFVLLWFSNTKRRPRGRSFGNYKLDSRYASVDVVVVARNGAECRELLNDITDRMIGFKTDKGGRVTEAGSLWGDNRSIDSASQPIRWARTARFDFGVGAQKIE